VTALPDLPRPKAIIFDWDNTLIDSWLTIHGALVATFEAMGRTPWTLDETRSRVRTSLREGFPGLFAERWEEAAKVFYAAYEAVHLERLMPLPGAAALLEALSARGDIHLAVVSNKRGSILRLEAGHLRWDRHFRAVVGAGDAARDKPSPEPLMLALVDDAIRPGPDVWYVGDADIDVEFACRTGCTPVLLSEAGFVAGQFGSYAPAATFTGCEALAAYIDEL